MKALIINFNRLTLPVKMAEWCVKHGLEPVFIDNHSSYRPLLKFYYESNCEVYRCSKNFGHKVVWDNKNILESLGITGRYIVTDPDLDLSGIPDDFLKVLNDGLDRYPAYSKCGFSLDLSNLPLGETRTWEQSLWSHPLDDMYFHAPIDTTFALYRENVTYYSLSGIRTNRPYTAIHIPWSYKKISALPKDEQFYYRTCNSDSATGKNRLKR
jgi:hypothetical protein